MRTRHSIRGSWSFTLSAALLLMCPFDLIASLGMDLYLPAIPDLPRLLAATPSQAQLTLSGYLLILGAGQLVFGPLSDRVGRRPVLLAGAAGYTLSSLGLAWARSLVAFVLLRVVESASGAAMVVATFATVRDVYASRKESTTIYGTMSAILVLVPAFGPLLGAALYELAGLRAIFVALAGLSALAGLRAATVWPETRPWESRSIRFEHVARVLRHRELWTYALGYAVAMGSFFVYVSIAPSLLVDRWGFSAFGFALVFGTVAVVLIVAARSAPKLVEHCGHAGSLRGGMLLVLLGAVLVVIGETMFDHVLALMIPGWVIATGIALTVSVAANGALAPFSDIAGTATALFHCTSSILLVGVGTIAIVALPTRTAWPLAIYAGLGACLVLVRLATLRREGAVRNDGP